MEITGIEIKNQQLVLGAFNPFHLTVSAEELHRFLTSLLENYHKFYSMSLEPEDEETEKRKENIRNAYEKKWRKNKTLITTEEEQQAYQEKYFCTLGNYNFYGSWIEKGYGRSILRISATGERSVTTNIFSTDHFQSHTEEELIDAIILTLANSYREQYL